jgi:hypothetical protein
MYIEPSSKSVAGFIPEGVDKVAPAVDRVLTDQMRRLQAFVENES